MDKQSTKENKQQATYWRKRLNWYLNEASTEEYDEEEVQAIMDLLPVLDPEGYKEEYYTPEKGLERFWQTYEIRKRIQDEFERLQAGEVSLADYPDEKKAIKYRPKHFSKFVTAAALVVAMFLGGTIGIYADRDGLFRKLNSGEDRDALISSSTSNGVGTEGYKSFEKLEDVPAKYLSCLWTPSNVPANLKVYQVELTEDDLIIKTYCKYGNKGDEQFLNATKVSFKESVVVTDQLYDGFEFYCKEQYDAIDVDYLKKENKDYTEFVVRFEYGDCVYALSSNCEFETLKELVKESILNLNL